MKKIGLSALAVAIMATSLNAGSPFTGATEWTQIANNVELAGQSAKQLQQYATQLKQYYQQVQQYKNQFQSYKMMLQNIRKLSPQQWNEFTKSVIGLKNAVNYGEGINFAATSFNSDFHKLFKGYDKYLAGAKDGSLNFSDTYKQLNKSTRDTLNGALNNLGLQAKDMENDEDTMKQLQKLSLSASGQKAAIQAANEIALHQTHTLKKLQQTIMTQANMQGEFYAAQNSKEELQQAKIKAFRDKADFSVGADHKKNTRRIQR